MLQNNTAVSTSTLLARQIKVRTLQYKATIFLFCFLLFAFWPQITSMYNNYQWAKDNLEAVKLQLDQKKLEQANVIKDVALLQKISQDGQRTALIQCYNTNCNSLPEEVNTEPQKSIVKAYLQLQQDTEKKFTIDQKKLLAYLNEFLLKSNNNTASLPVKGITFGWGGSAQNRVKQISVNISTSFQNKDALLWFLRNIEQYVSPTFPMLAAVESVTYDIVKANESQDVTINLSTYMLE